MSFQISKEYSPDVLVIGGGIVGLTIALELKKRGRDVAIVERGEQVGNECSSGNAGLIRRSRPEPLANLGSVRNGIKWMWNSSSPLYIQPTLANVPWLTRFTWESRPAQAARSSRIRASMFDESVGLHQQYCAEDMPTSYRNSGVLEVYGSEASFENGCSTLPVGIMAGRGVVASGSELRKIAPALTAHAAGGIFFPDDGFCNPRLLARAVAARDEELGVRILKSTEVLRFEMSSNRVTRVETSQGTFSPGVVVVSAGIWSQSLLSQIGLNLHMRPGKGYHVDYAMEKATSDVPMDIVDRRIIVSPFDGVLRLSGTMELTEIGNSIRQSRVDAIVQAGQEYVNFNASRPIETWAGLRPMPVDDVPLIGPTEVADNVIVATGHSMYGVVLAPVTARIVADMATGVSIPGELASALSPDRFQRMFGRRKARSAKVTMANLSD